MESSLGKGGGEGGEERICEHRTLMERCTVKLE
jgi:hypothetical protein